MTGRSQHQEAGETRESGHSGYRRPPGSAYVVAGAIGAKVESAINPADTEVPTTITIGKVSNVLSGNGQYLSVPSTGRVAAPSFTVGSYAGGSEPTTPVVGEIIFDSTTSKFKGWDGSVWVNFN